MYRKAPSHCGTLIMNLRIPQETDGGKRNFERTPSHEQSRDKGNVRPLVSPRASTSVRRPMLIL
jgi:hypothetical protein